MSSPPSMRVSSATPQRGMDPEEHSRMRAQDTSEVQELRVLLSRTAHGAPAEVVHHSEPLRIGERNVAALQCGAHSTAGLRKLDDGQSDDIVKLRRRRQEEDQRFAFQTNRRPWDSSVWIYIPPALKGVKPVTLEPWARCAMCIGVSWPTPSTCPRQPLSLGHSMLTRTAGPCHRDAATYESGMARGHGAKPRRKLTDPRYVQYVSPARVPEVPEHVRKIENSMRAYRHELGAQGIHHSERSTASGTASSPPPASSPASSPPTGLQAGLQAGTRLRATSAPPSRRGERSDRGHRGGGDRGSAVAQAATDRAERIRARSQASKPKPEELPKGKLQPKAPRSPTSVLSPPA